MILMYGQVWVSLTKVTSYNVGVVGTTAEACPGLRDQRTGGISWQASQKKLSWEEAGGFTH